jgi:hypothetical protein
MRSFRIVFIWQGSEHTRLFQAATVTAVVALVAREYAGCHIWKVEEV